MIAFEDWLCEQVNDAEADARDSHKLAMNSYGAGYDAGYLAALKLILEKATPQICGCTLED